jgi:two-component system chemotaxis response regulator CheB
LGLKLPVETTGPSIYQRIRDKSATQSITQKSFIKESKQLNVLCIDDSKTIHSLLKNILTEEQGFVIKNIAMNGAEALKLLETEKYDAITLDLHMPIIDGLGFLSQRKDKTPVIVVSSINREDESIAKEAIRLGALDYVEKPTIENLINSGNEIRAKIKSVIKQVKPRNVETTKKVDLSNKTLDRSKIKTLIVDDSETIRDLLAKIISSDPNFEIIGKAKDAFEAEKIMKQTKPDLITLDIHMPGKTGVEFLKEFQSKQFIPTVMISALSHEDGPFVMEALAAGAIDYIKKPEFKELTKLTPIIHERLKNAAKAKKAKTRIGQKRLLTNGAIDRDHVILIGASTGGTEAIRSLLESLPKEIPPILIVQHIPEVFSKAFADRLNSLMPFEVKEAVHEELVTPNKVLVAPGGKQMGIKIIGEKIVIQITEDPMMNRHRPSVDYLFKSAYEQKLKNATAVVLTGMGSDGSKEIIKLKSIGVRTIAQDEATSVIYGMPKAAAATGAIDFVLPLDQIGEKVMVLAEKKMSKQTG